MKARSHHGRLALLGITLACCAASPSTVVGAETRSIAEVARRLEKIPTNDFPVEVPAAARPLLTQLKHQLRELIAEALNSRFSASVNPPLLKSTLVAKLNESGVAVERKCEFSGYGRYGCIHDINIEQPSDHPTLVVATTTLGIPCGSDTSLYIFKHDANVWQLVLALEANDYDQINGAQHSLGYAISPADQHGNWFLVTAHVNAWCASAWRTLSYKVLRVGVTTYQPVVQLSGNAFIYGGYETLYELSAEEDRFRLSYIGLDEEEFVRNTLEYAVGAERINQSRSTKERLP